MINRMRQWWRQGPGRGDVLGINRRNLDLVFADYRPGKFRQLDDKLAAKKVLEAAGVPVPATLGAVTSQADWGILEELLATQDSLVLKPANGWGGKGILILHKSGDQWRRSGGIDISVDEIKEHVAEIMSGIFSLDEEMDAALCEELIVPHPFFATLGPEGLCDLRIVLEDHQPLQAMCRVPTRASDGKANLHGGGVGLGVDLADGKVNGAMVGDQRISRHPDTGQDLLDLQLPHWQQCVDLAVAASRTVDVRYMGVDIVVDRERGPLILEINARPGLAIQIANAAGQPVTTRTPASRLDRGTSIFNGLLMLALALAPFAFHWWQNEFSEVLVVDVGSNTARPTVVADQNPGGDFSAGTENIQLEEINLAESSLIFRDARDAAARGDTTAAKELYRTALVDSALAPFALNNLAVLARRSGQDSLALAHLTEAVDRFPTYHRGLYNMGLVLARTDRPDEARTVFARSLALKPNYAAAWAALGNLEFDARNYSAAVTTLGKAIRFDPTSTGARLKLGLTYRLQLNLPAAQGAFEELLALAPEFESGVYWLARTYQDRYRATAGDSLLFLQAAQTLLEESALRTPRLQSVSGTVAYELGDMRTAIRKFDQLAAGDYRRGYHRLALALTALELGDWQRAQKAAAGGRRYDREAAGRLGYLAQLGQALSNLDQTPPAADEAPGPIPRLVAALLAENQRLVGQILAQMAESTEPQDLSWAKWLAGRDDPADRERALNLPQAVAPFAVDAVGFEAHLDATPDIPLTYGLSLGYLIATAAADHAGAESHARILRRLRPEFLPFLRQDFAEAIAADERKRARELGTLILDLGLDDPHFVLDLAIVNQTSSKFRTARRLLRTLPADYRQIPEAIICASRLDLSAGKSRVAVKTLTELVKRAPSHLEARFALGEAHFADGGYAAAEKDLRAALDFDPARLDIRRVLARLLMKRTHYAAAAQQWSVVLSFTSTDASARFNYALCLQRSGDNEAAVQQYDAVLAENPNRTSAVFNKGLALMRVGRNAEAEKTFRRMLELVPDHEPSLRKLAELEGARK